jgi:hypothetical protein
MRALKILVIVMGLLLVAGTVAMVAAVASRLNHPPPPAAALTNDIALPAGAKIAGTEISGDRLVVRIARADGGEDVLIFNLATGARTASISLHATPTAP